MINPYAILGGALGGLLLLIGTYFYGRNDGAQIQIAKYAAVDAAVAKERAKRDDKVDQGNAAGQQQETARNTATKEVYREIQTVVDRPVYRNICVDADGVRFLDRAAAIANGEGASQPAEQAPAGATGATQAGRDAGRQSVAE